MGSPQQLVKVDVLKVPVAVASTRINVAVTARDLGVVIDSQLSLSTHWPAAVFHSGQLRSLRQLRPLIRSISAEAVKMLVQAFILCRLDYCNSLFYGITKGLMSRLQSVHMQLHVLAFRPHNANATGAALVSGSTSGGFQDGHPDLPVTVRHGSSLSGRRLSIGLLRRSSSAAFCHMGVRTVL